MRTPRYMPAFGRALLATGVLLAVTGCGSQSGGGAADTNTASGTATAAAPSGWKATDACAVMNKAAVSAAVGGTIKTATLGAVKAEGGGFPLYSQCEVLFEDGRMLVFGTAEGTNNEALADQVAEIRRQAKMIGGADPVDVPGLAKAAVWIADLHQLYAFLGDRRYVSATLTQTDFRKKADPIDTIKAQEIAILHTAGA